MFSWKERLNADLTPYRCLPFWSWNEELKKEDLLHQIELMQQAGMGGFFMHARSGLVTEYMGDEWFEAIEVAATEAARRGMNAWCYDENGWPSGFAGTKLLEDPSNFAHYLECRQIDGADPVALACYCLDNGRLVRVYDGSATYGVYDCTDDCVVDILNPAIVRQFIELTHEQYMEQLPQCMNGIVRGFFTDEPQYCRWFTAYTPLLPERYEATYGENLLDVLGALLIDCDQTPRTRFRYWRLVNQMYVESFIKQIYEWCEAHGLQLTGHTIEEQKLSMQMWGCAGAMPFYEYEHIPAVDWLGRDISTEITPKQVSSVACQFGKKQVLTESFACTGWDATPSELKRVLEWQYVHGVNQVSVHLFPYSTKGVRKYDHPAFFSDCLPWFTQLRGFFDYFARLGCMLAESEEPVSVGVIHPMHSAYLDYTREADEESIKPLEDSFAALVEEIGAAHIPHHFIDETLLEKYGSVDGAELVMNRCRYRYIIIPSMKGLDFSTVRLLTAFVANGGKVYLAGDCPSYIDGELVKETLFTSNCSWEDLQSAEFYVSDTHSPIRSTYRKSDTGDFIFTVNLSTKDVCTQTYTVRTSGIVRLNLETMTTSVTKYTEANGFVTFTVELQPGESAIFLCDVTGADSETVLGRRTEVSVDSDVAEILSCDENSFLLDKAQLSYDAERFTEAMPIEAIAARLLTEQQTRQVYLRFFFTVKEMPPSAFLESEYERTGCLFVNGQRVVQEGVGSLGRSYSRTNIAPYIQPGENTIVIGFVYHQDERVYDVLFRSGEVRESLKNCLAYDTDIVPIYLRGDFGVISEIPFEDHGEYVKATGPFAIARRPQTVRLGHLEQQGFPFFAGEIRLRIPLEGTMDIQGIRLNGRYAVAKVEHDGKAKTLLFGKQLPLTGTIQKALTVTLTSGNRNTFGPFHYKDIPEPHCVWGGHFTMEGTWNDAVSLQYDADYALVPFGIDGIDSYSLAYRAAAL